MAKENILRGLKEELENALVFKEKDLVERAEWGTITFESAEFDLERVFSILSSLNVLPLEHLTDDLAQQFQAPIKAIIPTLDKIDNFTIKQGEAPKIQIVNELHSQADQLFKVASPWIPYLAYMHGDVAENISRLTSSIEEAKRLVEASETYAAEKREEVDVIVTKAREASAAAGAAVFTKDFLDESNTNKTEASNWLNRATWLAIVTAAFAIFTWLFPDLPKVEGDAKTYVVYGSKLVILAVLFTATLWSAKIYKGLMHLSVVNRHKGLSIQTLQAFSHAASDTQTKDAVLIEATRAIFGNTSTGFLDSKTQGVDTPATTIVEVLKSTAQGQD